MPSESPTPSTAHQKVLDLDAKREHHRDHDPLPLQPWLELEIEYFQARLAEINEKLDILARRIKVLEIEVERLRQLRRPRVELTEEDKEEGRILVGKLLMRKFDGGDGEVQDGKDEKLQTVVEAIEDMYGFTEERAEAGAEAGVQMVEEAEGDELEE